MRAKKGSISYYKKKADKLFSELIRSRGKCAKCGKKNLNLRTQDNHKTYDCPACQIPDNKKGGIKK